MREGNPHVRIWEEVYNAYKNVALKHKLKISDLTSIVLLYAPVFSPLSVAVGLEDNYLMSREEALDIAYDLKEAIEKVIREKSKEEEELLEEVKVFVKEEA